MSRWARFSDSPHGVWVDLFEPPTGWRWARNLLPERPGLYHLARAPKRGWPGGTTACGMRFVKPRVGQHETSAGISGNLERNPVCVDCCLIGPYDNLLTG